MFGNLDIRYLSQKRHLQNMSDKLLGAKLLHGTYDNINNSPESGLCKWICYSNFDSPSPLCAFSVQLNDFTRDMFPVCTIIPIYPIDRIYEIH